MFVACCGLFGESICLVMYLTLFIFKMIHCTFDLGVSRKAFDNPDVMFTM